VGRCKLHGVPPSHPTSATPVCGMSVEPETPHRFMHAGEEVLFCSAGCKAKFEADPVKYLKPSEEDARRAAHAQGQGASAVDPASVPAGAKWTCAQSA